MVDLCSRHPHYRAVRVGNPIQASNLLKKYTVLEKKKNFSYNELPRYFLPNDKFTCIFGVFDIVSLSSACRENWFTILIDLRRIFMRI